MWSKIGKKAIVTGVRCRKGREVDLVENVVRDQITQDFVGHGTEFGFDLE